MEKIIEQCHSSAYDGHFGATKTSKVLQSNFYYPILFKDAHTLIFQCDRCQYSGNISNNNEILLNSILEVENFDVQGFDFMGPFASSFSN